MRVLLRAALVGLALVSAAKAQDTREFRLGPASPPSHPAMTHLYVPFQKYLAEESEGRLTGKVYGMDVVGLKEMRSAIKGGLIDIGLLLPTYFPSDFPDTSLTADLGLVGQNPLAVTAAVTEYIVFCAECQAEMAQYGGVFLSNGSTDVFHLLSRVPINGLDDLKGLKIRANSGLNARLSEALGAVPVKVTANDVFESMSQGAIDVSIGSTSDLVGQRLIDVAKYANTVSMGTQPTSSTFTVGKEVWGSLTPVDRKAVTRAATRATIDFTQGWGEMAATARKEATEAGIEFVEPDNELSNFVESFAIKDLETAGNLAERDYGITDAHAKLRRLQELYKKWASFCESVHNDPKAVIAEIDKEVWSKVDFTTYGL